MSTKDNEDNADYGSIAVFTYGHVDTSKMKHKERRATSETMKLNLYYIKFYYYGFNMKTWEVILETDVFHNGQYEYEYLFTDSSYSKAAKIFEKFKNMYKLMEK